MDPLSIMGSVAGVSTAGVALSSAIFDLIATIRNAPAEMIETAQAIHDLAIVLRELRRIIKKGRKILRSRLLEAVNAVIDRIRSMHQEVDRLLDVEGSLARIIWAFRKSKANKLLATIESHKSTVQLMATTITLALAQRHQSKHKSKGDSEDDIPVLRTEAETLVRVAEQSLQALESRERYSDKGTQTDQNDGFPQGMEGPYLVKSANLGVPQTLESDVAEPSSDNRIQTWCDAPEDTAAWLYRLVFQDIQVVRANSRTSDHTMGQPTSRDLLISAATKTSIIDRLLLQWTNLSAVEIDGTSASGLSSIGHPYARDLGRRVKLLLDRESMPLKPTSSDESSIGGSEEETSGAETSSAPGEAWNYPGSDSDFEGVNSELRKAKTVYGVDWLRERDATLKQLREGPSDDFPLLISPYTSKQRHRDL